MIGENHKNFKTSLILNNDVSILSTIWIESGFWPFCAGKIKGDAPNSPCHVSNSDGVSECGLSELPSSIHSDDGTEHDAFFVQTCLEEVKNAAYVTPQKPLLSLRGEEPLDKEVDPRSRLTEYVDSKKRLGSP